MRWHTRRGQDMAEGTFGQRLSPFASARITTGKDDKGKWQNMDPVVKEALQRAFKDQVEHDVHGFEDLLARAEKWADRIDRAVEFPSVEELRELGDLLEAEFDEQTPAFQSTRDTMGDDLPQPFESVTEEGEHAFFAQWSPGEDDLPTPFADEPIEDDVRLPEYGEDQSADDEYPPIPGEIPEDEGEAEEQVGWEGEEPSDMDLGVDPNR